MKTRRHRMGLRRSGRSQRGFTLVELMVSLVMFSFAIAGVLAVAVSIANGFREQRVGVGAETTVRAAMEFMGDAIRGASPGIETGLIINGVNGTCDTKTFEVTPRGDGTDELTVTFAYGSVVTSLETTYTQGSTSMSVASGAQFSPGDYLVVTDFSTAELLKVTSVTGNTLGVQASSCTVALPWSAGSLVIRALRAKFFIDDIDGTSKALWMDPEPDASDTDAEPLAEGIEDLQVAIGFDPNGNGVEENLASKTTDEWYGNSPLDVLPPLGTAIRAVRVSLVAKALAPITGNQTPYIRPALEDHPAGTADKFRRRVLTSVIEIRNLVGSQ